MTGVCDSRPLATRIGSLRSPLDSSYAITPFSIFSGFTTLLLAPQAAPSSFSLFQSLFQSRHFPALFPALWLGLFRFPHVFPYSFSRLTCPGRSCSHRVALLLPFSPLAYSLCCRALPRRSGAAHSTLGRALASRFLIPQTAGGHNRPLPTCVLQRGSSR